jgi:hypothetical protein
MLERFTYLLPFRLLIIGWGITCLGLVETGRTELKCIKKNQEKNYCELTQGGIYWSKHTQKFNLKSVAINSVTSTERDRDISDKYNTVYSHSLIFNTEREAINLRLYFDLREPEEIKRKADYFLDNKSEKLLVLKDPDLSLIDRIYHSISGALMIFIGLFFTNPE